MYWHKVTHNKVLKHLKHGEYHKMQLHIWSGGVQVAFYKVTSAVAKLPGTQWILVDKVNQSSFQSRPVSN